MTDDNQTTQTFATLGLRDEIMHAIKDAGYEKPTPIQAAAIPKILAGRNVVGVAQTGTGKTASFTLPMLHQLAAGRARARMPRSLILSPTRELATQISQNFEVYGKYLNLSMALLIGGVAMGDQEKALEKGVDVLIATPGRLIDWFERGKILLGGVNILVIDEADRMLDMGFIPDVEKIVQLLLNRRQTLLFSATMPPEVRRLADRFLTDPEEIKVSTPKSEVPLVDDVLVEVGDKNKRAMLDKLIATQSIGKAIVFCNRKRDVTSVNRYLQGRGRNAREIHGDLEQAQRQATLNAFKNDEVDYLIATDVAARGLDITDMPVVINFDVPMNAEDYVHRIGRTGRAGRKGRAFTFVTDEDGKYVASIERFINRKIERLDSVNAPAAAADKGAEKSEEAPKPARRRSRAKTAEAPAAEAAAPETPEVAAAVNAEETAPAPARRRRRKPAAAATETQPAAEAAAPEAAEQAAPAEEEAPKKPARRTRKASTRSKPAAKAEPAGEAAPVEAAPAEDKPAAEPEQPVLFQVETRVETPVEAEAPAPVEAEAPVEAVAEAEPVEDKPAPAKKPAARRAATRKPRPSRAKAAAKPAAEEVPAEEAEAAPAPAPEAEAKPAAPAKAKAASRGSRRGKGDDSSDHQPIVGMGDHTPAFLLRPVPLKALGRQD